MKIFISWSKERSGAVARALRDWLPLFSDEIKPWISAEIGVGRDWRRVVLNELKSAKAGILCVTAANLESRWLLFEAGAMIRKPLVWPLLIDIAPDALSGSPLDQFHSKSAGLERVSILNLVTEINNQLNQRLPPERIQERFNTLWPKLEADLSSLPPSSGETHAIVGRNARAFWLPHTRGEGINYIVITEPWFFRDLPDRVYLRHFDVNKPKSSLLARKLKKWKLDSAALKAVHHYVSIGEVGARDTIADLLRGIDQDVSIQFGTSYETNYSALKKKHMILTGTYRASTAIQEFQETSLVFDHRIEGVRCRTTHKIYKDRPGAYYYGIVSRVVDKKTELAKTVIACNHGPATSAIAESLRGESIWPDVFRNLLIPNHTFLPGAFQILLKVPLGEDDETVSGAPSVEDSVPLTPAKKIVRRQSRIAKL